jgi:hypothetical protein
MFDVGVVLGLEASYEGFLALQLIPVSKLEAILVELCGAGGRFHVGFGGG